MPSASTSASNGARSSFAESSLAGIITIDEDSPMVSPQ